VFLLRLPGGVYTQSEAGILPIPTRA
jgi:hypothetical protein